MRRRFSPSKRHSFLNDLTGGCHGALRSHRAAADTQQGARDPFQHPQTAPSSNQDSSPSCTDRRTEVTFEIKAFKVTAACASGYTEGSHLEMPQYSVKLLLPDADRSLAEIKVELLLLEDELPKDQMQAQERSAMSGTSSDGTDDDDQGKPHFSDSLPPGGIRSSRKKTKKERQQLAAQKNTETTEVEKEVLILKISCWNQAELAEEGTTPSLMRTLLEIIIFTIFVFVIFMCVTNGGE